jgi:hypothetical protein
MCLSPFAAIAVEKMWRERPRMYAASVSAALIVLAGGAYAHYTYITWPAPPTMPGVHFEKKPSLDRSAFQIRLTQPEDWAGVCDALLRITPANSILLVDDGSVYYPAFTARALYVAASNRIYPGLNLFEDDIDADVRGYGRQIVEQRRATLADVFGAAGADGAARRDRALDAILALKRPVAIVAEPRHPELIAWLEHNKTATRLYAQSGLSLWLIDGSGNSSTTSFGAIQTGSLARKTEAAPNAAGEGLF